MDTSKRLRNETARIVTSKTKRQILPALAVAGSVCGLAAAPAFALELGELRIDSTLGEPLRASVAYALQPNEQIAKFCIFLRPAAGADGIPGIGNPRISITDSAVLLHGRTPVREPLLAMQLVVNCPNTVNLAREYTLMIDPASPASGARVARNSEEMPTTPLPRSIVTAQEIGPSSEAAPAAAPEPLAHATPEPVPSTTRAVDTPIAAGSRYQVQPGDSLSQIVSRIGGRTMALWPAVEAVFAANPNAFQNRDRNLIHAGAWLVIPDLTVAGAVDATTDASSTLLEPTVDDTELLSAYYGIPATGVAARTELIEESPPAAIKTTTALEEPVLPSTSPVEQAAAAETTPALPVGDATGIVDIPDTVIDVTEVVQPAASLSGEEPGTASLWSRWLGGASLVLVLALLIFGRRFLHRYLSLAVGTLAARSVRRKRAVAKNAADPRFVRDIGVSSSMSATPEVIVNEAGVQAAEQVGEGESRALKINMPEKSLGDTILTREITPTSTGAYDLSHSADLSEQPVAEEPGTIDDLETISCESGDTSVSSIIKDGERRVFEEDYKAAVEATGIITMILPEAIRDLALDPADTGIFNADTVELPVSQDPADTLATAPKIAESMTLDQEEPEVPEPKSKVS